MAHSQNYQNNFDVWKVHKINHSACLFSSVILLDIFKNNKNTFQSGKEILIHLTILLDFFLIWWSYWIWKVYTDRHGVIKILPSIVFNRKSDKNINGFILYFVKSLLFHYLSKKFHGICPNLIIFVKIVYFHFLGSIFYKKF